MRFHRISKEEREEISRLLAQKKSVSEIARMLGRHRSSIHREIKKNSYNRTTYRAFSANRISQSNKSRSGRKNKLDSNIELYEVVIKWLQLNWSPVQIMERLKLEYPDDEDMRISHETIYRYLYIKPRKDLLRHLRREHKYRRKQKNEAKNETRGKVPNMISIDERPIEIEDRRIPGHWEGDLILGKQSKSALGTLSERSTRYTLIVKIEDSKYRASSVREAFTEAFRGIPEELKKSLTYDQGREMKEHEIFSKETNIKVYFAHVGSPWERGTNENTNSLIRQYFPSNTNFLEVSKEEILRVQNELNDRPRKCLGYQKPNEVFLKLLQ